MKDYKLDTVALHAGQQVDSDTRSRGVPIYRTSSYVFKNTGHAADLFALKEFGNIYTRIMNPTQDILEKRMSELEGGGAALALASGTAAIFYSIINLCKSGDEIVSANNLYGGTYTMFTTILKQFNINVKLVGPNNYEDYEKNITEKTRGIYIETIGNPVLDVTDIEQVAKIAQKHHLPLIVDSTFTTPYLIKPFDYGANIVIHSLTKWIGGHGTGIGGIVVDGANFDWTDNKFELFNEPDESYHGIRFAHDLGDLNPVAFVIRMRLVQLRNLGACISPDNAWIFLQGLETLPLRMKRHSENALKAAEYLQQHDKVNWVKYPGLPENTDYTIAKKYLKNGFGGMVVFGIKGGYDAAVKLINNIKLFSHLANVGDAKSLIIHPASTTHSQLSKDELEKGGITQDFIRLSIGIENIDDIINALEEGLSNT